MDGMERSKSALENSISSCAPTGTAKELTSNRMSLQKHMREHYQVVAQAELRDER